MRVIKVKVLYGKFRGQTGTAVIPNIDDEELAGHITFYPDNEPAQKYFIFRAFVEPLRNDGGEIIEVQV